MLAPATSCEKCENDKEHGNVNACNGGMWHAHDDPGRVPKRHALRRGASGLPPFHPPGFPRMVRSRRTKKTTAAGQDPQWTTRF
eukprot:6149902-Prorocentrum_lima.AAC.1